MAEVPTLLTIKPKIVERNKRNDPQTLFLQEVFSRFPSNSEKTVKFCDRYLRIHWSSIPFYKPKKPQSDRPTWFLLARKSKHHGQSSTRSVVTNPVPWDLPS